MTGSNEGNGERYDSGWHDLLGWYRDMCKEVALSVIAETTRSGRPEKTVLNEIVLWHKIEVYKNKAQLIIALSSHDDEYELVNGAPAPSDKLRAFWALRADIAEYIEVLRDENGNNDGGDQQ